MKKVPHSKAKKSTSSKKAQPDESYDDDSSLNLSDSRLPLFKKKKKNLSLNHEEKLKELNVNDESLSQSQRRTISFRQKSLRNNQSFSFDTPDSNNLVATPTTLKNTNVTNDLTPDENSLPLPISPVNGKQSIFRKQKKNQISDFEISRWDSSNSYVSAEPSLKTKAVETSENNSDSPTLNLVQPDAGTIPFRRKNMRKNRSVLLNDNDVVTPSALSNTNDFALDENTLALPISPVKGKQSIFRKQKKNQISEFEISRWDSSDSNISIEPSTKAGESQNNDDSLPLNPVNARTIPLKQKNIRNGKSFSDDNDISTPTALSNTNNVTNDFALDENTFALPISAIKEKQSIFRKQKKHLISDFEISRWDSSDSNISVEPSIKTSENNGDSLTLNLVDTRAVPFKQKNTRNRKSFSLNISETTTTMNTRNVNNDSDVNNESSILPTRKTSKNIFMRGSHKISDFDITRESSDQSTNVSSNVLNISIDKTDRCEPESPFSLDPIKVLYQAVENNVSQNKEQDLLETSIVAEKCYASKLRNSGNDKPHLNTTSESQIHEQLDSFYSFNDENLNELPSLASSESEMENTRTRNSTLNISSVSQKSFTNKCEIESRDKLATSTQSETLLSPIKISNKMNDELSDVGLSSETSMKISEKSTACIGTQNVCSTPAISISLCSSEKNSIHNDELPEVPNVFKTPAPPPSQSSKANANQLNYDDYCQKKFKEMRENGRKKLMKEQAESWATPKPKPKLPVPALGPPKQIRKIARKKRPADFATNRLYKYIQSKVKDEFGLDYIIRAETFVEYLADVVKKVQRRNTYQRKLIHDLKVEMAKLKVITNTLDFYGFIQDYLPYKFRDRVIPHYVPGTTTSWPPCDVAEINDPIL